MIENKTELCEIVSLFMKENDEDALKKLDKLTNDKLVGILLNWNKEYSERIHENFTYESEMYEDIMEYIWDKYQLDEVNNEKNIEDELEQVDE